MVAAGEIAALGATAGVAILIVARSSRIAAAISAAVLGVTVIAFAARSTPATPPLPANVPGPTTAIGYVTSAACLGCHPGEHASFRRTYHRTMTQVASVDSVKAPLGDPRFPLERRNGSEIWATLPDPDLVIERKAAPLVTRRVVITTGSHREQAYWVAGRRSGDLRLVPFVWMLKGNAFLARRDAFLLPPDAPMPPVRWASSCIACHAVGGEPRHDLERDVFDTRAVDLGIACEACHGPGAEHVEKFRDPVARYVQHATKEKRSTDTKIVHPARLSPERSAALCGQCHAYAFPKDEAGFWTDGYSRAFRAGDALEPSRTLFRANMPTANANGVSPTIEAAVDSLFWPDGAVRVGGREYNGLIASPCYERGTGERKMTCISCHSMHKGDPRGQMIPAFKSEPSNACTSAACHASMASIAATTAHTHHTIGSPGSACPSCHMPKTSYALLSAVRSHRIESPTMKSLAALGGASAKPSACNLCHLDRSRSWTRKMLADWYRQPLAHSTDPDDDITEGIRAGLAGDASVRALIADALGSPEATAASHGSSAALRATLDEIVAHESYPAVRFIALRSQANLAPTKSLPLDERLVRALLAIRDERPITIAE